MALDLSSSYMRKHFSKVYLPLIEMLLSNITVIEDQGIQDMDGTNFSLGLSLGKEKWEPHKLYSSDDALCECCKR